MNRHVLVKSFPRIHITLIDMAGTTFRRYGGAGFALEKLPVEVEATVASETSLTFAQEVDARDKLDAEALLVRVAHALRSSFAVHIRSLPPQHVGFGSKTALLLAIGAACNALLGNPLREADLKALSGRGGASGIGVSTFFTGGFVVDVGHPHSTDTSFRPSSASHDFVAPPVAVRVPFPQEWQVHLFLGAGRRYAGGEEANFFVQNTPIPADEVLQVLAAIYHGLVPAFLTVDLRLLKDALADVHTVGFKLRELHGQSESVQHLVQFLNRHADLAVGMSSMGPLVYIVAPLEASALLRGVVAEAQQANLGRYVGACAGRNEGHEVVASG